MPNTSAGERVHTTTWKMHLWGYLRIMVWHCVRQVQHVTRPKKNQDHPGSRSTPKQWWCLKLPSSLPPQYKIHVRHSKCLSRAYSTITKPDKKEYEIYLVPRVWTGLPRNDQHHDQWHSTQTLQPWAWNHPCYRCRTRRNCIKRVPETGKRLLGANRPCQLSPHPLWKELLSDRESITHAVVGNDHTPIQPPGHPIWFIHRPSALDPNLQWQQDREWKSGEALPEGTRIPVHHEIPSRQKQLLRLPVTTSFTPHKLLQTATSRYDHIWRWWTLYQQVSNRWPTWCSNPDNGTAGYKAGPTATETYQLHTERPLNQWPWPHRVPPVVFHELAYYQGVMLRGTDYLFQTQSWHQAQGTLRLHVVDIAHEGHQGAVKFKQLLRAKVWFPQLDKMVDTKSQELPCLSSHHICSHSRPTKAIETSRSPLAVYWYILLGATTKWKTLVMIDEYTRYPEVEFTNSIGAWAVIPHIDRVFSTHGFPDSVKTDGGPPFNGTGSHEYQLYMKWAGVKTIVVSLEDPEANGLAENFMKPLSKVWHTAHIEGKNAKQEMHKFLWHYRLTPHTTTGPSRAPVQPQIHSAPTRATGTSTWPQNRSMKCTSQNKAKGLQRFQSEY